MSGIKSWWCMCWDRSPYHRELQLQLCPSSTHLYDGVSTARVLEARAISRTNVCWACVTTVVCWADIRLSVLLHVWHQFVAVDYSVILSLARQHRWQNFWDWSHFLTRHSHTVPLPYQRDQLFRLLTLRWLLFLSPAFCCQRSSTASLDLLLLKPKIYSRIFWPKSKASNPLLRSIGTLLHWSVQSKICIAPL